MRRQVAHISSLFQSEALQAHTNLHQERSKILAASITRHFFYILKHSERNLQLTLHPFTKKKSAPLWRVGRSAPSLKLNFGGTAFLSLERKTEKNVQD